MRGRGRGQSQQMGRGGRGRGFPLRMAFGRGGRGGERGSSTTCLQPSGMLGRASVAGGESGRWRAENVGPNTCSNPSLPAHLASDSQQAKANKASKCRSTPSPVGTAAAGARVPVEATVPKTTVETVVVDLSSDSELDSPPDSPRSYSSSPSSSWTTTSSPEGQDDMTVPLKLFLLDTKCETTGRCTQAWSFYGPVLPSPPCGRLASVLSYAQKWVLPSERLFYYGDKITHQLHLS